MTSFDHEKPGRQPQKVFDPMQFARAYGKTILGVGSVLFLITFSTMFAMKRTSYTATGVIRIAPTMPFVLKDVSASSGRGAYGGYVNTQVARLKQYEVLMAALNRLPPAFKSRFVDEDDSLLDAAIKLKGLLDVRTIRGTHLVGLTIQDEDPEGLAEIINSLINVFLEKVADEEEGLDNRRLAYLKQEKNQVSAQLTQVSGQLKALSLQLGVVNFGEETNTVMKRNQLQEAYLSAQAETLLSRNRHANILKQVDSTKNAPLDDLITLEMVNDKYLQEREMWTDNAKRELAAVIETLTEDNPQRMDVSERIAELDANLHNLREDARVRTKERLQLQRGYNLKDQISKAEVQYEANQKFEENLRVELERAQGEVFEISDQLLKGRELSSEISRLSALYDRLEARIYSLTVESKAPGRISLETVARSIKDQKVKKLLRLSLVGSFGSVLAICLLLFQLDHKIRTRKDFENAVGSPPSWPLVNHRTEGGHAEEFSRLLLEAPRSKAARAIGSLAAKLDRERTGNGAKVAVVTGASRKAGTTRIALNCAQAMSQHCERVLLVDADRLHGDLTNIVMKGHVSVNAGSDHMDWKKWVHRDSERNMDVLCTSGECGLAKLSRKECLTVLNELKEAYDFVVLDTACLLVSDFTEFLCQHSDVTVLVTAGNRTSSEEAYNATDILVRSGTPSVASVLNWAPCDKQLLRKGLLKMLPKSVWGQVFLSKSSQSVEDTV